MKHWDGRDRPEAAELPHATMPPAWRHGRLPQRDRQRLARMFMGPPPSRRQPSPAGSKIGLVLAIGVLVGLAWLLSPADPVSSKILN